MTDKTLKKEFSYIKDKIIEKRYQNLDQKQKEAVFSSSRNCAIIACPGAGKTTVIINRINHLIEDLKIDEGNIIVLTFTKSAANNMKNRYIKSYNKVKSPFFGTFHGLFYKILLREGNNIKIIDEFTKNKLMEGVLKKYFDEINEDRIKEAINNISLYKTSRINIESFEPSFSKEIFIECYENYSNYKDENNLWDFDDLAIKVIELFTKNEKIRESYKKLFKYMLVDEFQDSDEIQIDFLKIINEDKTNSLFAVGDEDQCIYSFRGSRPEYMVTFNKIFKGGVKYYLTKNYRSNKNIVEASKKIIEFNKERNNKEILWNKNEDGIISYLNPWNERMQGEKIVENIKDLLKTDKTAYKDNIILYRTNMESISVIDVFIRNKIPFKILDKGYNFFNHFICKDLLAYLKLAKDSNDREAFIKIINKPFRYISKGNLAYLRDYKEDLNPFDILINKKDTPPFQMKKLADLKRDFNFVNKSTLSYGIQTIITELGYIEYLKAYCDRFKTSIEDLEEIIEVFKSAASAFTNINDFLIHVEEVESKIEESKNSKDEDRVLLSTIHGVKGMEFKNVFIINCNEDTIPHASSKDTNLEEERRLFYVGITRAIDNLFLYAPRTRAGETKEHSRFIGEGGFAGENSKTFGIKEKATVNHRAFGLGTVEEINGDEIKLLFEDGVRRRFSVKVLMENNLITIIN